MTDCTHCTKMFRPVYARGVCLQCYCRFRNEKRLNELPKSKVKGRDTPCEDCDKLNKRCQRCHARDTKTGIYFFGQKSSISSPPGHKDTIKMLIEQEKKRVYEDLGKNPRKWLDMA